MAMIVRLPLLTLRHNERSWTYSPGEKPISLSDGERGRYYAVCGNDDNCTIVYFTNKNTSSVISSMDDLQRFNIKPLRTLLEGHAMTISAETKSGQFGKIIIEHRKTISRRGR